MKKQKLLFVMSNLNNGGAERSLVNLLQMIDYSMYEVDLILFQKIGMFLKLVPKDVNILDTDLEKLFVPNLGKKIKKSGINKYDVKRIIYTAIYKRKYGKSLKFKQYRWKEKYKNCISVYPKEYDTAIAYLHGEPIYYLVDCVNAKKKIGWVHNEYTKAGLDAEFDREYYGNLDSIVTISDLCADVLKQTFPEYTDRICVLSNLTSSGIVRKMADDFVPEEYKTYKKNYDGMILVSIGRLHPQKGFDIAIEVAKILKDENFSFKWFILGSGDLLAELESKRKEYDVQDVIEFIGSKENPYPYLKNADIVVQPSRYEGKSIVLDETKILAKPIVVTNYTTVRDQISDYEGKVVELNSKDIADAIIWMKDNRDRFSNYLNSNEYGNQDEIVHYYKLFEL